jgi:hypothetical protein
MPKEVNRAALPKKIDYTYIGKKERLRDIIGKSIPKELIPSKNTGFIFGAIFLIVVIISLLTFPLGDLLSGKADMRIEVGIPWRFMVFDLEDTDATPVKIGGLFLDLLVYLLISYAVDVVINIFLGGALFKKRNKKEFPKQYKLERKTLIEKAAEKTTEKVVSNPQNPPKA